MRDYGTVTPGFWIGATGKSLRGNAAAQVLALYLMTSPHATASGVYHCPMIYMTHETGLSSEGASKALQDLKQVGFCQYDDASDFVFVVQMAKYQIAESLKLDDKRVLWINRQLDGMPKPLRRAFFDVYSSAFHLTAETSKNGKISPLEGAFSPLRSQDQDQEQEQDISGKAVSPRKSASKTPRTELPEDFSLTDDMRQAMLKRHPDCDVDDSFLQFCAYHRSRATLMARWSQAWTTWIGNAEKFGYPKRRATVVGIHAGVVMR